MRATVLLCLVLAMCSAHGQRMSAVGDQRFHRYKFGGGRFDIANLREADVVAIVEPLGRIEEEERTYTYLGKEHKMLVTVEQFQVLSGVGVRAGDPVDAVISRPTDSKGQKAKFFPFTAERYLLVGQKAKNGFLEHRPYYRPSDDQDHTIRIKQVRPTEIRGLDLTSTTARVLPVRNDLVATILLATVEALGPTDRESAALDTLRRISAKEGETIENMPAAKWLRDVLAPKVGTDMFGLMLKVRWQAPGSVEALLARANEAEKEAEKRYYELSMLDYANGSWADLKPSFLVDNLMRAKTYELKMFCLRSIASAITAEEHKKMLPLLEDEDIDVRMNTLRWFAKEYDHKDKMPAWIEDNGWPFTIKDEAELVAFWRQFRG